MRRVKVHVFCIGKHISAELRDSEHIALRAIRVSSLRMLKQLTIFCGIFLLFGCSARLSEQVEELPMHQAVRVPADPLPYIQEALAEMRNDYETAVALQRDLQSVESGSPRLQLISSYIDFLIDTIDRMEELITMAESSELSAEQYGEYRNLRGQWRDKSATVFRMMLQGAGH